MLAKIEVHAGFVDFNDGLEPLEQLLASLDSIKGGFGFCGELQDLVTDAELGLLELESSNALSQWEQKQVEKVLGEGVLGVGGGGWPVGKPETGEEFRIAD